MAAENITNLEAWVENANTQLNSIAQNFAELEIDKTNNGTSTNLMNLLETVEDLSKEHKQTRRRYEEIGVDLVEMANSLQFQLDLAEKTFELLTVADRQKSTTAAAAAATTNAPLTPKKGISNTVTPRCLNKFY